MNSKSSPEKHDIHNHQTPNDEGAGNADTPIREEATPEEHAVLDFAFRLRQEAREYGWPGSVTMIERVLDEWLSHER